jgi:hypothetical protein
MPILYKKPIKAQSGTPTGAINTGRTIQNVGGNDELSYLNKDGSLVNTKYTNLADLSAANNIRQFKEAANAGLWNGALINGKMGFKNTPEYAKHVNAGRPLNEYNGNVGYATYNGNEYPISREMYGQNRKYLDALIEPSSAYSSLGKYYDEAYPTIQ